MPPQWNWFFTIKSGEEFLINRYWDCPIICVTCDTSLSSKEEVHKCRVFLKKNLSPCDCRYYYYRYYMLNAVDLLWELSYSGYCSSSPKTRVFVSEEGNSIPPPRKPAFFRANTDRM